MDGGGRAMRGEITELPRKPEPRRQSRGTVIETNVYG